MNIYKYPLAVVHESELRLRKNAKILDFQFQRDELVVWVLEDARYDHIDRRLTMWWTGEMIPYDFLGQHLKTLQCPDGLVIHIFEDLS